jgi:hypothetical protein
MCHGPFTSSPVYQGIHPLRPYKASVWFCGKMWHWECGLCRPAARGATQSLAKTMRNIALHHRRTRYYHHLHVIKLQCYGPLTAAEQRALLTYVKR